LRDLTHHDTIPYEEKEKGWGIPKLHLFRGIGRGVLRVACLINATLLRKRKKERL